jgi:hypothetical protein
VRKAEATSTPSSASTSAAWLVLRMSSIARAEHRFRTDLRMGLNSNNNGHEGRNNNGRTRLFLLDMRIRRDPGGDGDGDGDSVSTVFYSDQGESGAAASASEGEGEATTEAGVMNGFAVPTSVNGRGNRVRRFRIRRCRLSWVDLLDSSREQKQSQAESSRTPPKRRSHHLLDVDPSPETVICIDHVGPFVLRIAESLLQMVRAF